MIIPVDTIDQLQVETQKKATEEQQQKVPAKVDESIKEQKQEAPAKVDETIGEQKLQDKAASRKRPQKRNRKKGKEKEEGEGEKQDKVITPKSPTIYLLKEEKGYLDRLKAFILLETGDKMSDHELVMEALKEYVGKNYKEFAAKI